MWKPRDLALDPSQLGEKGRRTQLLKLFQLAKEAKCELVEGESPAEAGMKLALKLREAKVL